MCERLSLLSYYDLKECLISKNNIVIHLSVVFPIKYKLIVIKVLNDGFLIPNPRFCEAPEIHSVNLSIKRECIYEAKQ